MCELKEDLFFLLPFLLLLLFLFFLLFLLFLCSFHQLGNALLLLVLVFLPAFNKAFWPWASLLLFRSLRLADSCPHPPARGAFSNRPKMQMANTCSLLQLHLGSIQFLFTIHVFFWTNWYIDRIYAKSFLNKIRLWGDFWKRNLVGNRAGYCKQREQDFRRSTASAMCFPMIPDETQRARTKETGPKNGQSQTKQRKTKTLVAGRQTV